MRGLFQEGMKGCEKTRRRKPDLLKERKRGGAA